MDNNFLEEKRLELGIERKILQLLKDLNDIESRNYVKNSNMKEMEEVYNYLSKAEYYIIRALSWSSGVDPAKFDILNSSVALLLNKKQ